MIPKRRWLMIQICRKDKEKVYEAICTGKIDAAEMSFPNLIDDILLTMKRRGLTAPLAQALPDKRRDNSHIPFDILLCLAVAAKLKRKTSLTDVPFAVTEAELLAELGWNLWDNERDVNEGLFTRIANTVNFFYTVWQGRNAFSGDDDIIIIGIPNCRSKIIAQYKLIAFINENNAVLHHRELPGPCTAFQNRTFLIAGKLDGAGSSVFVMFAYHVYQRCFSSRAVSPDYSDISLDFKVIPNTFILQADSMCTSHSSTSHTYRPAIGTSSFMLWTI